MAHDLSPAALAQRWRQQNAQSETAKVESKDAHGSAGWLSSDEINAHRQDPDSVLFDANPRSLLFGRDSGHSLKYGGTGHCLTFAPTGAGKSVSVVVPNLLTYPGSVVCIDPKGAIPAITAARRRAMGQEVVLLDPFAEVEHAMTASGQLQAWQPVERATYNPLSQLDLDSPDIIEDARLMAASLIMEELGKNRYFSDCARTIAECLILDLITAAPPQGRTLENLFDLASRPRHVFENKMLPQMQERNAFQGHVARLGQQILSYSGEGGNSIWSTLHRSLNLLQSPRLLSACQSSAVDFRSLKDKPTTVYLVLPANRLNTHSVWLRLILSIILNQLSDARASRYPVLFLVDECAALGKLEILETAVGLMRGYGMKLWLIFQDLPQVQRIYGDSWSTFVSNSGVKQFFNVNDTVTSDFVSGYLGNETRRVFSENINLDQLAGGGSIGVLQRSLLTSDEVRRLEKHEQVLFYEGLKPIRAAKLSYWQDREFQGLFAPDPYVAPLK
jgi:type IV secretion system protein VirD4